MRGAGGVVNLTYCVCAIGLISPLGARAGENVQTSTPLVDPIVQTETAETREPQPAGGDADSPDADVAPRQRYLSLNSIDAYLDLRAEYTNTRVERDEGQLFRRQRRQEDENLHFEESLGLRLDGAVIDPRIMTYRGDVSFGLVQDRFKERIDWFNQTDEDNGQLLRYDLRADFFRGKPITGSVYGLRQDDRINRRFQPTLDQRRNGFGTNWLLSDDKLPMELSYDYLETDREGNWDERDDDHFTESTLHYKADWLISQRQKLTFSYDHSETKQEYQGLRQAFETTRDLFKTEHSLDFGDDGRHNLRTLMRWQEESGDFARDIFEIGPQLTLKHSDTLQTIYKYQFNGESYEGLDIDTHRADFQLVHQLYSNLTTTFDAFALYEDIDRDVDTTQYGASVDWQYNRKNRWGRLNANLAIGYDTEESDGDDGRRIVLDEAVAFRDPIDPWLRNRNVVPSSIIVTDASNRRVFRPGIDFLVYTIGNVTRLSRVRTGAIQDGDTVLVDYQYDTPTDGSIDTVRTDFSIEQRFTNGLRPYYRFAHRNQEDDPTFGFYRLADRTDHHRIGTVYEKDRYSLGAEYEIFDDTVEPYDAYHLNGSVRLVQTAEHTVGASSKFSRFFFEEEDDRNVTLIDCQLDHRWQLTRKLSTIERLAYRFEDDSIDGNTHAWDVSAGFTYDWGDLSGELTFEYDRLDLPRSEEDNYGVYVTVRRELNDVPRR